MRWFSGSCRQRSASPKAAHPPQLPAFPVAPCKIQVDMAHLATCSACNVLPSHNACHKMACGCYSSPFRLLDLLKIMGEGDQADHVQREPLRLQRHICDMLPVCLPDICQL